MSPVGLEHDSDFATCHHCHITSPIPFDELIKTHPLRSSVAKDSPGKVKNDSQKSSPKGKTSKIKPDKGFDVQSVLEEVASNEYRHRKFRNSSSTSEQSSPPKSLKRISTNDRKYVKPVHSFLLHESSASPYKISERASGSQNLCTLHSKKSYRSDTQNSLTNGVVLDALNLEASYNSSPSLSKEYATIRKDTKTINLNPKLKDCQTQTSEKSSVTKANGVLFHARPSASEVSLYSIINRDKYTKRKKCDKFFCSLPSGLLFAGYGLLIVIGIVIAVALIDLLLTLLEHLFPILEIQELLLGSTPQIRANTVARKRIRPVQRVAPQENVIPVSNVIQSPQRPIPANQQGIPLQNFREDDLDYFETIGVNDHDFLLPNPNEVQRPQAPFQPPQPPRQQIPQQSFPQQNFPQQNFHQQEAFKPVEIQPQFRPQARAPAQEVLTIARPNQRQQQAPAPRRPVASDEPAPTRGQKEPEVQIIKSWSNRNADGTFSWGYLNTDGSFKNETKGADCVVRGIYGYIDKATGDTLTFPYESGNPCNPNDPDYFFDYDEGTLSVGGQVVNQPKRNNVAVRRRP
ncbi:hypothetical protein Avbf_19084 [Armadillidium vulgare]|nr:hypothetical protein Avbf_19084 [Armadillidium vulgare]